VLIDSNWHGSTEASEWYRLCLAIGAAPTAAQLSAESATHLNQFLDRYEGAGEVNVCGTGPSIQGILQHDPGSAVNMMCNTGILSGVVVEHVRPAAVAFLNPLYCGPAVQARQVIGGVRAAIQRYGSWAVMPEGYLHFLLAENYPDLRHHLIGLSPTKEVTLPQRHTPRTYRTNNVVTTLMLPLAAALRPRRILIWGCDGKPPDSPDKWRYAAEQTAARASNEHTAYSSFLDAMSASKRYYELHCERMEKIVEHIESMDRGCLRGAFPHSCACIEIPRRSPSSKTRARADRQVKVASSSDCRWAACSRAFATRSNSVFTRCLICSAHSIWLGVPVISAPCCPGGRARQVHFDLACGVSREGMVSCEYFLQLTQAKATHNALQASASETDTYPSGRDTISTAGLKMNARTSKATVMVYWVPVDF
jgi:hypothetical protein